MLRNDKFVSGGIVVVRLKIRYEEDWEASLDYHDEKMSSSPCLSFLNPYLPSHDCSQATVARVAPLKAV